MSSLRKQPSISELRDHWARLGLTEPPRIAGADGSTDVVEETETETPSVLEIKNASEALRREQEGIRDLIKQVMEGKTEPSGEVKDEHKKREAAAAKLNDHLEGLLKQSETYQSFLSKLNERLEKLEKEPVGEPRGIAKGDRQRDYKRYDRENYFQDISVGIHKDRDSDVMTAVKGYDAQFHTPERLKVWATGDLEDVDLIVPDIQQALPFLAAAAQTVKLCRELRTTSPSVEFPVYTSGLDVDFTAETVTKPESEPTFDLRQARVYTIAGTTEVPNQTLEDYPVARGWISSELGRATGVKEDLAVLQGSGTGQPTGILNHSEITARAATQVGADADNINGRAIIEAIFRAIQDVRTGGFTEPSDIVMNPMVWTDVVLSFESNIGYLYGPPQGAGFPEEEPKPRLLGKPVTLDSYVTTTYGSTTNQSPVIVGNFQDAIVLRRSPFRVDFDTSKGFTENTTWFRGEERMGFIVIRPASFKVVTNIVPF